MSILLLLLGPGTLKRERWLYLRLGLLLSATGAAVALRSPDDLTLAVLEAAGWIVVASGIAHLGFGGLLLLRWREASTRAVPLFLGPAEEAVRYYLEFHVPRRFSEKYVSAAPAADDDLTRPHDELLVHVRTPTAIAEAEGGANLVSRYVAVRDRQGGFAVGHAALQMAPDVYISHCDGNPDAFTGADEVWQTLRSRDNPGVFNESFEEEVAHYPKPTATMGFQRFRADQLRVFWRRYRTVTDYNFTNRNCSVAVSMALEAALVGVLAGSRSLAGILSLLTRSELWVAHFIRWKAREMVWTPGMMLDYARALESLVESR